MNLVVLGLPGAGKGTQSRKISSDFGFFYFEAGSFLRDMAKKDDKIMRIINSGRLVPDKIMNSKVFEYLEKGRKYEKGVLFDGYPRSVLQWDSLTKWFSQKGRKIDLILFLDLSVEEAVRRLSSRRVCPKCGRVYNLLTDPPRIDNLCNICRVALYQREDDREDIIRRRFREQEKSLLPLIDLLRRKDNFFRIDASQKIDKVYEDMVTIIKQHYNEKHNTD